MNTTIPTVEPKGYAVTAAELRRIADALDTLPSGDEPLSGQLYMFAHEGGADAVDAILFAIDGTRGETKLTADQWAHSGWISTPCLSIYVKAKVPGPPDERDAEIERLRADLADAQKTIRVFVAPKPEPADPTGLKFSREAEDPEPGVVADGIEGGSVTGRASVPDMQTRPQCSPECAASPFVQRHIADCPVRAAEQNGGE